MSASAVGSDRHSPWLFSPVPDLLFGCGALYLLIFAALSFVGPSIRVAQPLVLFPLLILALSVPHYGATILRVYEHRRDRRAYAIFSVWATLLVLAWFAFGVFDHRVGSWLLTLFLTWSPWHYTGQNYGIAVMFLRRAGVPLDPATKRALYASFVLSFVLTAIVLNSGAGTVGYDVAGATAEGRHIRFLPLGIPTSVTDVVTPALAVAWVAATLLAGLRLVQRAPLRSLAPAAGIAAMHATWFGIPVVLRHFDLAPFESLDFDMRTYYFTWIALAHALQYLWVTSYYARAGSDWSGGGRYFLKALLVGQMLFVLPVVLCAPLGGLTYDGGLALLVSSAVNVHHFILDGAIWKLRNSRVARVLIRSGGDDPVDARDSRLGVGFWGVAAACMAAGLYAQWTDLFRVPRLMVTRDYASAAQALDQTGWFGFDHENKRAQLAESLLKQGRPDAAAEQARRSLELRESSEGWRLLGDAQLRSRSPDAALESYRHGLDLQPDSLRLLLRLAQANARTGNTARAQELLQQARFLARADPNASAMIARVEARLAAQEAR